MNADIHGLSGAYAVDALDDVERAEFERHLGQCPECQEEVASLRAAGLVYACECARSTFAGWSAHHGAPWSGPGCPGRCRERRLVNDGSAGVRVALGAGLEGWDDLLLGPSAGDVAATGDLLVRDRMGNWTYAFCVVVDDLRQGVDLVIRGRDLVDATAPQIRLVVHWRAMPEARTPLVDFEVNLIDPQSCGRVSLTTADAGGAMSIDPGYLSCQADGTLLARGIDLVRLVARTRACRAAGIDGPRRASRGGVSAMLCSARACNCASPTSRPVIRLNSAARAGAVVRSRSVRPVV